MIILLLVVGFVLLYFAAKQKATKINETHNREERNNPKFVPATESQARGMAWIVVILAFLLLMVLCANTPNASVILLGK